MIQRTLSIIKPDAIRNDNIGNVLARLEAAGLRPVAMKMIHLDDELAGGFYQEHKEKPFYSKLVETMTANPVVVQVLEGEDAIAKNREVMGATNPQEAEAGTIRGDYGDSLDANTVHGSDSETSAAREIAYFFSDAEIYPR